MSCRVQRVALYYNINRWTHFILVHTGPLELLFCTSMSENGYSKLGTPSRSVEKFPGERPTHIERKLLQCKLMNSFPHVSLLGKVVMAP
jgi:hypothetical protein